MFMGLSNYNFTKQKSTVKMTADTGINCEIFFDFEMVHPGQNITGAVVVSTTDALRSIEQIIMEVVGTAQCEWKYNKHLVKLPKIYMKGTKFFGQEQIFFSRHTLAGGSAGTFEVHEMSDMYSFKTSLPAHLPATWKGHNGIIKYTAEVIIKQLQKPLQMFRKEIHVSPRRDLKLEQYLLCEARQDIHRSFRYAIISLGNVEVSVWLPLCGIAAGQSVPVLCTIVNESTVQFGGLVFLLTRLEIYRSKHPTVAVKTYRKDICRVPRMVDILQGTYEFYCMLDTDPDTHPTNQYWKCKCCQVVYEIWVSLQGSLPRYKAYGYPNIDTPGIPLIIGTEPLCEWDSQEVTDEVMGSVYAAHPPIVMEPLPPDDDIEEMLINADEELDPETERNLDRQLVDEPLFQLDEDISEDTADDSTINEEKGNENA